VFAVEKSFLGGFRVLKEAVSAFSSGEEFQAHAAESGGVSPVAGDTPIDFDAVGLATIFDEDKMIFVGDFAELSGRKGKTEKMDPDNGFGFWSNGFFDGFGKDLTGDPVDIDEDGNGAKREDGTDRCSPGISGDDDLVAGANIVSEHTCLQGSRTGGDEPAYMLVSVKPAYGFFGFGNTLEGNPFLLAEGFQHLVQGFLPACGIGGHGFSDHFGAMHEGKYGDDCGKVKSCPYGRNVLKSFAKGVWGAQHGVMSIRFTLLGSSSSGNCGLLESGDTRVLLDAGYTGKRICQMLEEAGTSIDKLHGVFLTHEHGDHSQGIKGLKRYRHLKWLANERTARFLHGKFPGTQGWEIFQTGQAFRFRDLEVEAYGVPHDAMEPVAFRFRAGEGDLFSPYRSLAWVTDLGYLPQHLLMGIRQVDALIMESNYDRRMLEEDVKRPWSVKQRISSRHGHLSNQDVLGFLSSEEGARWSRVMLVHLSKDCNCPRLLADQVKDRGINRFSVDIAPPDVTLPALDL